MNKNIKNTASVRSRAVFRSYVCRHVFTHLRKSYNFKRFRRKRNNAKYVHAVTYIDSLKYPYFNKDYSYKMRVLWHYNKLMAITVDIYMIAKAFTIMLLLLFMTTKISYECRYEWYEVYLKKVDLPRYTE